MEGQERQEKEASQSDWEHYSQVTVLSPRSPPLTSQKRSASRRIRYYFRLLTIQDLCLFSPTKNKYQKPRAARREKVDNEHLMWGRRSPGTFMGTLFI